MKNYNTIYQIFIICSHYSVIQIEFQWIHNLFLLLFHLEYRLSRKRCKTSSAQYVYEKNQPNWRNGQGANMSSPNIMGWRSKFWQFDNNQFEFYFLICVFIFFFPSSIHDRALNWMMICKIYWKKSLLSFLSFWISYITHYWSVVRWCF